jgi:hypothetical protein
MIGRKISRKVTRWLVVVLVFAQGAVAVSACLAASSARMEAVAAAAHEGCAMQERNLNLCLYHCADQYSNGGAPEFAFLAPLLAPLLLPVTAGDSTAPAEVRMIVTRATGPPIPILHCCFRI